MSASPAGPDSAGGRLLVQAHDVLCRTGAFGVVVLGHSSVNPVTLSGSGAELWEVLTTPRLESEVIEAFARNYHVAPSVIAADLVPVIDRLVELGALDANS